MAITLEEYNNLNGKSFETLNTNARKLMGRLNRFREERLAAGLPFSGRLRQSYDEMINSLATLSQAESGAEAQTQALEDVNKLAGFLNVNVAPGKLTVRDLLMKRNNEADQAELEEELAQLGGILKIATGKETAPLFDYRKQNDQKKADTDFMQTLIGRDGYHVIYGERPYQDALGDLQNAFRELLSNRVNRIVTTDPKIRESAQEIFDWTTTLGAAIRGDSDAVKEIEINNEELKLSRKMTKQQALERLRDGFNDFLSKKIRLGGQTMTGEEWLGWSAKQCNWSEGKLENALSMTKKLLNPATRAEPVPGAETQSAAAAIDGLMAPVRKDQAELTAERLAGIFGVRMAVGAERNELSALKTAQITEDQKLYYQRQLLENPIFQQFCSENMNELNRLAKKRGHGGALEDKFRDYLCKLPAGQLPNDPSLRRWLPTCRERIEALQKQAAASESGVDRVEAMAEIVVLRGIARADRGNKRSLEKPIPVDESNSLQNSTRLLMEKRDFQEAAYANRKYISEGHGGKMVEKIRAFENDPVKLQTAETKQNAATMKYLNRTTYKGQVERIRAEAALMLDAIASGKKPDMEMRREYRELCFELFALKDSLAENGKKQGEDVDHILKDDKINAIKDNPRFSAANLNALRPEDMQKGLQSMLEKDLSKFSPGAAFPERINAHGEVIRESLANIEGPALQ